MLGGAAPSKPPWARRRPQSGTCRGRCLAQRQLRALLQQILRQRPPVTRPSSAKVQASPLPPSGDASQPERGAKRALEQEEERGSASAASQRKVKCVWPRMKLRKLLGFETRDPGIGASAGAYPLGDLLGKGSVGQVYASSLGGYQLAVKVFSKAKALFAQQECAIAEHVTGVPHLVELLDAVWRSDGASMLVYAFAGHDLDTMLQPGWTRGLPSEKVVALHVLRGFNVLHGTGLYHRDVKPANILVMKCLASGWVCSLSYIGGAVEVGVGSASVRLRASRTTIWYRSPELLRGCWEAQSWKWHSADVWALGISLCHMMGMEFFKVWDKVSTAKKLLDQLKKHFGKDLVSEGEMEPVRLVPFASCMGSHSVAKQCLREGGLDRY